MTLSEIRCQNVDIIYVIDINLILDLLKVKATVGY